MNDVYLALYCIDILSPRPDCYVFTQCGGSQCSQISRPPQCPSLVWFTLLMWCVKKNTCQFWWKLLRTVWVSQEVIDNPVGSQNKTHSLMANLHEWRKRATLHTRCRGGVPAEFMRASFARSKQLLSATALWEALCMQLEGRGKVANQWLRQAALKLLDVLQIEQLVVPLQSDRDGLFSRVWVQTFMFHESQVCALSTRIELFMLFFYAVSLLTANVWDLLH